jgi:hypothetical protein
MNKINPLKNKIIGSKNWAIYGIVVVLVAAFLFVLLNFLNNSGLFCCTDGFVSADVFTWLDSNANGQHDRGELPMGNIAVVLLDNGQYPSKQRFEGVHSKTDFDGDGITDVDGLANLFVFMPGCKRRCWDGYSVALEIPVGYQPTTPIMYALENNDTKFEFGFKETP